MPSAASVKCDKQASSEAADNSPVRQIMLIIEHKIRNLEKRKSKLVSYRDFQKSGKELNADQKVAVAKYDEVAQTLEFVRDLNKQVIGIATTAERDAKKQAKKEAWARSTAETNKIRDVLLILDCLVQMGADTARIDFLAGSNGAARLTEDDLRVLDELYPEVTPKHDLEEGQSVFHTQATKAAEHLYAIVDGKPKEMLGSTYAHIKEIVNVVHQCGYFDRSEETPQPEVVEPVEQYCVEPVEEQPPVPPAEAPPTVAPEAPPSPLPVLPPAPGALPTLVPMLRSLPPLGRPAAVTLQEVEHAYFTQQFAHQRPISEVIGSQNFFFLQESEIDSPIGTPQSPMIPQQSPVNALPIHTQTFTNQNFVGVPPQHFVPEVPSTQNVGPDPGPNPHFQGPTEPAPTVTGYPGGGPPLAPAVPHVQPQLT